MTGASGFVGSAVCRHLHTLGWTVRGVVRRRGHEEATAWELLRGDLRDDATVQTAVRGADLVVHAAGLAHVPAPRQVEREFYVQNVEVTERVARAVVDSGASMIYVSSAAAASGRGPYGLSKRLAEERLEQIGRTRGLRWTTIRPALVFGERDPGNFLQLVVAVSRRRFVYIDGGRARKSLSYVGNVGPAIVALARSDRAAGGVYYLADPQPHTVREIITVISECLGVPPPHLSLAGPVARVLGAIGSAAASVGLRAPLRLDMVEALVRDVVVDTRPLEEEMGTPLPIPFREGVRNTVEWCRDTHIIS